MGVPLSVLRREYVALINSSSAASPSGLRWGSRWMMDEICASGLAVPNCATCPLRMKWSGDRPSQTVSAARLFTEEPKNRD